MGKAVDVNRDYKDRKHSDESWGTAGDHFLTLMKESAFPEHYRRAAHLTNRLFSFTALRETLIIVTQEYQCFCVSFTDPK